jgi:hypothetical protein
LENDFGLPFPGSAAYRNPQAQYSQVFGDRCSITEKLVLFTFWNPQLFDVFSLS